MALTEVAQFASEVEAIAGSAGDPSMALDRLQSAIDIALASISLFTTEETGQRAGQPVVTDKKQAAPLLAELLQALDSDNPDQAEPILDALARSLSPNVLLPLRTCIDNFDFRGAETIARQIAADLLIEE